VLGRSKARHETVIRVKGRNCLIGFY